MTDEIKQVNAIKNAVKVAIEKMGLKEFKKTSFFVSNVYRKK